MGGSVIGIRVFMKFWEGLLSIGIPYSGSLFDTC